MSAARFRFPGARLAFAAAPPLALLAVALGAIVLGAIVLAAAAAPAASADMPPGDPSRGRTLFKQCQGCHALKPGRHNSFGPNLYRVIGRKAGSVEGYPYSEALENAGFEWTPERLDGYLTDPKAYLPGVTMNLKGIADARARADIIAYILAASARE